MQNKIPRLMLFVLSLILWNPLFTSAAFATDERQPAQSEPAPSVMQDSAEPEPFIQSLFGDKSFTSSATVYLTSNYIFRGVTQTKGRAAVQGSLDINHVSGVSFGGFASNVEVDSGTTAVPEKALTEADLYLLYSRTIDGIGLGAMAMWYNYVEDPHLNAMEYSVYARYRILKLDVAYMSKYFGLESASTYARLTASLPISTKDSFNVSAGYTDFEDEAKIGFKKFWDYKASVSHSGSDFTLEFAFTDTQRDDLKNKRQSDKALAVILSRGF